MVMNPILEISTPVTATNRSTDLWRAVHLFSRSRDSWRTVQQGLVWIQVPGHRYRIHKPCLDCQTLNGGFPKIWGTLLGVPIIRIIIFWGLYWGPLIL